jgi:hypothetical protein
LNTKKNRTCGIENSCPGLDRANNVAVLNWLIGSQLKVGKELVHYYSTGVK